MKLVDIIKDINNLDEELIIFQASKEDFTSDILLLHKEEGDNGVKEKEGIAYHYLLEVFIVKEFIEDWKNSLNEKPSELEIAKRLFEYGINDA
jgi:hypothetical protein